MCFLNHDPTCKIVNEPTASRIGKKIANLVF